MIARQVIALTILASVACGFTIQTTTTTRTKTSSLSMGLFDGVREAFSAPTLEKSSIDKERETPIDRWMGWSVASDTNQQQKQQVLANFVDSMDEKNYAIVELEKPMGIVFEENDADYGGIFVQAIKEDGVAFRAGTVKEGDQLVGVDTTKVTSLGFDDALNAIIESKHERTKLILFRGSAKQLYGPTGASQKWLEEFIGVPDDAATTTVSEN